jgi:hypothetical protein
MHIVGLLLAISLIVTPAFAKGSSAAHHSSGTNHHSSSGSTHYGSSNPEHSIGSSYRDSNEHAKSSPAPKAVPSREASASASATQDIKRDKNGKIARSPAAKHNFEKSQPCPSTGKTSGGCPGYVIDHVKPLACGGADAPSNMQWQSVSAAKAKDAVERKQCGK